MSMVLNGTSQYAHRADTIPASRSIGAWVRRDTDNGLVQDIFGFGGDVTGDRAGLVQVTATDNMRPTYGGTNGTNLATSVGTGTWWWIFQTYQGETTPGSSADGVLVTRYLASSGTDWAATVTMSSLSDNAARTHLLIGAEQSDGNDLAPFTYAMMKVWDAVVSSADGLTEREYYNVQTNTGDEWANYHFETGALDADSSGNSRTLTLVGTPTFSSDVPADILGDDPDGGSSALLSVMMSHGLFI